MADDYDDLLYGDGSEKPVHLSAELDLDPKAPDPEPEPDGPSVQIQFSGFNWWVTDKEIEQRLSASGEGLFQVSQLNLLQDDASGKFRGIADALLRTDESDSQVLTLVAKAFPPEFGQDGKIATRLMTRRARAVKAPPPTAKPVKPAPMLYEDPANPIPRYLLADAGRGGDRPKKSDDGKRTRKEKGKHDRKDRDKRRRDRDRDRSDSYEYYDDDYDYDRKRKEDRDDRGKRRRDDDGHRDKHRR
jgi:hypothetical protein